MRENIVIICSVSDITCTIYFITCSVVYVLGLEIELMDRMGQNCKPLGWIKTVINTVKVNNNKISLPDEAPTLDEKAR